MAQDDTPKVGDGTPDAALFISEEAFRAGFNACLAFVMKKGGDAHILGSTELMRAESKAWDDYEPSEMSKSLS